MNVFFIGNFLTSIFETLCFLKRCPIFDELKKYVFLELDFCINILQGDICPINFTTEVTLIKMLKYTFCLSWPNNLSVRRGIIFQ